jgi:hypothetical protein
MVVVTPSSRQRAYPEREYIFQGASKVKTMVVSSLRIACSDTLETRTLSFSFIITKSSLIAKHLSLGSKQKRKIDKMCDSVCHTGRQTTRADFLGDYRSTVFVSVLIWRLFRLAPCFLDPVICCDCLLVVASYHSSNETAETASRHRSESDLPSTVSMRMVSYMRLGRCG